MVKMITLNSRDEWLEHRKKYIGGSDCAAIVGMNPYRTNIELWQIKTGQLVPEDISEQPYVKYGTNAEQHLRELFKLDFPQYKVEYIENNSFSNSNYPWARASLDGWLTDQNGRKGILEIKTSEILNSQHMEKWKGDHIPQNYYCQIIFYMAVLEADFCVLKAQLKTVFEGIPYLQTKHFFIERAEVQADIDYLMKKGSEFWEYVKNNHCPPLMLPQI